jgi:hypothetical protein
MLTPELKKGLDGLMFAIDKRLSHVTTVTIDLNKFPEFVTKYQSILVDWVPTSEGPFFLLFKYGHGRPYEGPYQYQKLLQYFRQQDLIKTIRSADQRIEVLNTSDHAIIVNHRNAAFEKLAHIFSDDVTFALDK